MTAGGRVLNVTAHGESVADARQRAYDAVACIDLPGGQYRQDIALGALHVTA
jgi:phosphoribosylamine---glycine ligase